MVDLSEIRYLILKTVSGLLTATLFSANLMRLKEGTNYYIQQMMCSYNLAFTVLIIFTEFSPYILENYLVYSFPFLSTNTGKGIFYLVLGSFCFDPELNNLAYISGQLLVIAGVGWIIHDWVEKDKQQEVEGGAARRAAAGGFSSSSGIDFGKYLEKKPKYEKEFLKGKKPETGMQELSSSVYKPPDIAASLDGANNV